MGRFYTAFDGVSVTLSNERESISGVLSVDYQIERGDRSVGEPKHICVVDEESYTFKYTIDGEENETEYLVAVEHPLYTILIDLFADNINEQIEGTL